VDEKRNRLIALLVVVLIAAAGAATSCHHKATGGELVLTGATDPGVNAFMPPAASPPPTTTQPAPTLQPQGDGNALETQPLPGDRDGLYGGTVNNAEIDRDKIVDFLGAHPAQASAFVESLNTDTTLYWSGGRSLTVADIPTYLHELTPMALRLDTRVTNHGFDGTHFTTVQSVFEAGTAVLVDAHGVPRVRGLSGNPLTAPIALNGEPKLVGAPWPGYRPGALAKVLPTTAAITNFVLVDVVNGQPFNRPVGTTGTNDTPHTQPVASPAPATSAPPTTGQTPQLDIDGSYVHHYSSWTCNGTDYLYLVHDFPITVTHQGSSLTINGFGTQGPLTGTVNADGSFSTDVVSHGANIAVQGVFATEGGRTVIHGERQGAGCTGAWTGTKQ
jgi:hypothetical protein